MKKLIFALPILGALVFFTNCKKSETSTSSNIATEVVSNLNTISSQYTPDSVDSNSSAGISVQSDPCDGVSDFGVCQSNLIREYGKLKLYFN
jgi:hypothetical protein